MTPIDKLTERVDALTHTVENLSGLMQTYMAKIDDYIGKSEAMFTVLVKAVADHEHRLTDIEEDENNHA